MSAELHVVDDAGGLGFVTLDEFVAVDEPGAGALVGESGSALVPEDGEVMAFGDGGSGKTTMEIDLAFHLAAGDHWCGLTIPNAVRVGIIENEGPRALFREKLRRKRDTWQGGDLGDRVHVLEQPWSVFSFADEQHRAWLADAIAELDLAIVFLGPLTRIGMNEAGTLQETRDFAALLADVRARIAPRRVTFYLVHHENKAGEVSGAWEGAGDTLLHVTGLGHGRTKLHIRKARWSSDWHGKTLNLTWADGESFTVDDQPDRDDNAIADKIRAAVRANPGCSWNAVEKAGGIGNLKTARRIRDRLLEAGELIDENAAQSTRIMALWDASDPLRPVRLDAYAPLDAPEDGEDQRPRSEQGASGASVPIKDAPADADAPPPSPNGNNRRWSPATLAELDAYLADHGETP